MKLVMETERGGCRLYRNVGDRKRATTQLQKRGWNYFTGFRDCGDSKYPAGLSYGKADWVVNGYPYKKDIH